MKLPSIRIRALISLILISLAGLIVLQIIFLRITLKVKEEQFNHTVLNTLHQVVRHYEDLEIYYYKKNSYDLSNSLLKEKFFTKQANRHIYLNPELILVEFSYLDKVTKQVVFNGNQVAISSLVLNRSNNLGRINLKNASNKFLYLTTKEFLTLKPVLERLDKNLFFQLLSQKLKEKEVFFPLEYAVIQNGKILYRTEYYKSDNSVKSFQTQLFPNDKFTLNSSMLSVQFHKNFMFGLRSILSLGIPSILFTLILLFGSIYTFYLIFKQKKLSKIKNDFINNMTHEFKTPISTISLASQMINDTSLKRSTKLIDRVSKILNHETIRLNAQVDRVLQTAIYDNEGFNLKKKKLDIHKLINELAVNFNILAKNKKGTIKYVLLAKNSYILGDEVHISNMISSLVDNAIKYCKNNTTPDVTIATKNKNNKLFISFIDKGVGILKKDQKTVFEKFFRVQIDNTHNVKGFGLGLSYVKEIVDLHDGFVRLESVINKGSKFHIYLPTT